MKEENQRKKQKEVFWNHIHVEFIFNFMITILNNTMYVKLTSEMLINPASLREETTFSRGLRPPVEPGIE